MNKPLRKMACDACGGIGSITNAFAGETQRCQKCAGWGHVLMLEVDPGDQPIFSHLTERKTPR